jgi:hypothetical protein
MTGYGRALATAARRAGAPGRIRFTERQLYYELCRVLQPLHRLPGRPRFTLAPPVSYESYRAALRRHGEVAGLLGDAPRPVHAPPPEVYDYGLPRLLICQDATIAAMLLANELHMESACPVFSVADLPLDPRVAQALGTVYVLHDASGAGFAALGRVREWAGELSVRPLGLRPVHAASLHLGRSPDRTRGGMKATDLPRVDGLLPWELRWLRSGRTVEVAAVNPARLLRTVHRLVRNQARARPQRPRLRQIREVGFLSWPVPTSPRTGEPL